MRKAGDVLRDFLKERGWPTEDPYAPLFRGWEEIAGSELGSRSRVVEVEDGVIVVEVDHPGWLQMLQLRKRSLLQAARGAVPGGRIEDLRGRLARPAKR
jgi:predicted nucleic acid-binding Zn ribbon protein